MNRKTEASLPKYHSAINRILNIEGSLHVADHADTVYDSYGPSDVASGQREQCNISNSCDDASHSSISIISEDSQQSGPHTSAFNEADVLNKTNYKPDQHPFYNKPFSKVSSFAPNQPSNRLGIFPNQIDNGVFVKTALYDTISPLRRPSEAEQKVEELTEKIEKEMNLIGELQQTYRNNFNENALNVDLLKNQVHLKQKPPPPYYGYHHTNTPTKQMNNDFQNFPIFSKNSNSEPRQFPSMNTTEATEEAVCADDYYQQLLQNFSEKFNFLGTCVKCKQQISSINDACQASGEMYHKECLSCSSCGRSLKGKAFYNVQGNIYCKDDYLYSGFQQTSEKCAICGHLIIIDILQAMGNSYHPSCFKCHLCGLCLDGVAFTIDVHNNIYCIKDYHSLYAPKCAACSRGIVPSQDNGVTTRVVSMEKDFHVECYKCFDCHMKLTNGRGELCYPLDGVLLCKKCHLTRIT